MTDQFDSQVVDAMELAKVSIPGMYFKKEPRRFQGLRDFASRAFGVPGPKPRFKEITYRGPNPPMLSQFLARAGEYREDPISWETYDVMRLNPIVRLGLVARSSPLFTALREARVQCEDAAIAAFVKGVFVDDWLVKLANTSIIPSYIYGIAPHEKVWEVKDTYVTYTDDAGAEQVAWDAPALTFKKLKYVSPQSLDRFLLQAKTLDYAGFVQKPRPGESERVVVAEKSFTFIRNFIFGGLWGESDLRIIYPHWYYVEFFRALLADYLKLNAIPPLIGYAPPGTSTNTDGDEVDNLEHAGSTLQQAYSSLVVMLPSQTDERGNQMWRYEELRVGDHGTVFERAIENLQVDILRGLLVPERTITQDRAAVGSYNQAAIHAERLIDMAKVEVDEFLDYVNRYIVKQLVEDHFGPGAPTAAVYTQTMSEDLKEKLFNIIITLLQNDKFGIISQQLAFKELLDFLRIPYNKSDEGIITPDELIGNKENNQEKEDKED